MLRGSERKGLEIRNSLAEGGDYVIVGANADLETHYDIYYIIVANSSLYYCLSPSGALWDAILPFCSRHSLPPNIYFRTGLACQLCPCGGGAGPWENGSNFFISRGGVHLFWSGRFWGSSYSLPNNRFGTAMAFGVI